MSECCLEAFSKTPGGDLLFFLKASGLLLPVPFFEVSKGCVGL